MNTNTRQEITAHIGLRGLAATSVFIGHASYQFLAQDHPFLSSLFSLSKWFNAGVDLFFVLSGFILTYVYCSTPLTFVAFRSFVFARIARIFPLHLFISLSILLWLISTNAPASDMPSSTVSLLKNFFLCHTWPFVGSGWNWNAPSWSVSVEWLLYISVFPILLWARKFFSAHWLCLVGVLVFTAIDFGALYQWERGGPSFLGSHQTIFRGISGFTIGFFLFSFYQRNHSPHSQWLLVWFVAFLGTISFCAMGYTPAAAVIFTIPGLVLETARGRGKIISFLSTTPLRFLGEISYSVYLWHIPLLRVTQHLFLGDEIGAKPSNPILYILLTSVAVIGVSYLTWLWIEMPCRRALRNLLEKRYKESCNNA